VSLWRSIVEGFGSRVGSEIAKKSVDELDEPSAEEQAKAATSKKRKIALVIVAVSLFGLLALSGALTAIFKWLLGAAFIAGALGGGWYLVRNRWYALRKTMTEKRVKEIEEKAKAGEQESIEAQLRELKRKKSEDRSTD
jgi:hypothetical protein